MLSFLASLFRRDAILLSKIGDNGVKEMTKLIIPAKSFHRFDAPQAQERSGEHPVKYRFYAPVDSIPEALLDWMYTNPRDQNLNTETAKIIYESLLSEGVPCFYLWNRGILISAEKVVFDNRSGLVTLYLDDPLIHGNIDGGHTLRIILDCKKKVKDGLVPRMPDQYVELEVITGLTSPEGLAEARNTSVAVDLKSMEELRRSFDVLKGILAGCVFENGQRLLDHVEFRQNQMRAAKDRDSGAAQMPSNWVDVREIISILNMFNQVLYPNKDLKGVQPIQSFSGKEVGLKKFLQAGLDQSASDEECREAREDLLRKMAPIIPDIFLLWDHIECNFTDATRQLNKRYGSRRYAKGRNPSALLSNQPLEYVIPKGIMYPVVGSFRALVRVDEEGMYYWAVPPILAWKSMKAALASFVMDTSEELANNPASIGRSSNLWSNLFSNMYVYALQAEAENRS